MGAPTRFHCTDRALTGKGLVHMFTRGLELDTDRP